MGTKKSRDSRSLWAFRAGGPGCPMSLAPRKGLCSPDSDPHPHWHLSSARQTHKGTSESLFFFSFSPKGALWQWFELRNIVLIAPHTAQSLSGKLCLQISELRTWYFLLVKFLLYNLSIKNITLIYFSKSSLILITSSFTRKVGIHSFFPLSSLTLYLNTGKGLLVINPD